MRDIWLLRVVAARYARVGTPMSMVDCGSIAFPLGVARTLLLARIIDAAKFDAAL